MSDARGISIIIVIILDAPLIFFFKFLGVQVDTNDEADECC